MRSVILRSGATKDLLFAMVKSRFLALLGMTEGSK